MDWQENKYRAQLLQKALDINSKNIECLRQFEASQCERECIGCSVQCDLELDLQSVLSQWDYLRTL